MKIVGVEVYEQRFDLPWNFFCVSKASRWAPSILRVCRESRFEALKSYKPVLFDHYEQQENNKPIYFNQEADVIYFGELASISTMVHLFETGVHIPRVAIDMHHYYKNVSYGDDENIKSLLEGEIGHDVVQTFHVLHGFDRAIISGDNLTWPGCSGLREVTWVFQRDWEIKPGKIDNSIGLQSMELCSVCNPKGLPAAPFNHPVCQKCGYDYGREGWESLQSQMEHLEAGVGLFGVGKINKWVGENMPVVQYANLFRSKVRDYRTIDFYDNSNYGSFLGEGSKKSFWELDGRSAMVSTKFNLEAPPNQDGKGTYIITFEGQRKCVER